MSNKEFGPELFFGLVGAVGTDLSSVANKLRQKLKIVDYQSTQIILSDLIAVADKSKDWGKINSGPDEIRVEELMKSGTKIRHRMENGDAVARLSLVGVKKLRFEKTGSPNRPVARQAYIFKSLKHPDEVRLLRKLYGDSFFLVSVFQPEAKRIENLAGKIAKSHNRKIGDADCQEARRLNEIDHRELDHRDIGDTLGQRVSDTFHLADLFVRADKNLEEDLERFIRLLFGAPFITPVKDEVGMFLAKASALKSADLSRQVGAVITSESGEIISTGCNEVPKPGGGTYWEGDDPDRRDFKDKQDPNAIMKNDILREIFSFLQRASWLTEERCDADIDSLMLEAFSKSEPVIPKESRVSQILEFGKVVHAEMHAITEAARKGVSTAGAFLYCTTLPCHNCARHILAAGFKRVIYIEPYPKSLTKYLYSHAVNIADDDKHDLDAVAFDPFVGIAPNRYIRLFEMVKRKNSDGYAVEEDNLSREPTVYTKIDYVHSEDGFIDSLSQLFGDNLNR